MATPKKKSTDGQEKTTRWPFGMKNYILFAVSIVVMVIGFIALGYGSMTLAPILLVLAYCVLMPLAIILKDRPENGSQAPETTDQQ